MFNIWALRSVAEHTNSWYNSIGASDVDDLIFGSDDQVIYSER